MALLDDVTIGGAEPATVTPAPPASASGGLLSDVNIGAKAPVVAPSASTIAPVSTTPPDTSGLFKDTSSFINGFKIGGVTTPSGAPQKLPEAYPTGPDTISSAPPETMWDKIIAPIKNILTQNDPRTANIHDAIVNNNLIDIGTKLGIDKQIPIDTTKDPSVQQYYHDQSVADYVKNNWGAIQKANPNLPANPDMLSPAYSDLEKNLRGYTESLGLPYTPTNIERAGMLLTLPVVAGLVDNPVTGTLALGAFMGLDKAKVALLGDTLSNIISDKFGLNNSTRGILNIVEMFGEGGALYGMYKASPDIATAFTKDFVNEYMPGKTIRFEPEQIHAIFSQGVERGVITQAEHDLITSVVGKGGNKAWLDAAKNGTSIEVPPEKILSIVDKPWFAKIKDTLGLSTEPNVTKVSAGEPKVGAETRLSHLLGDGANTLKKGADILDTEAQAHVTTHGAGLTSQTLQEKLGVNPIAAEGIVSRATVGKPEELLRKSSPKAEIGYRGAEEVIKEINSKGISVPSNIKGDMKGQTFTMKKVLIEDILKNDLDAKEFADNFKGKSAKFKNEPIIIGDWQGNKNAVMDGWHRLAALRNSGVKEINAYVGSKEQGSNLGAEMPSEVGVTSFRGKPVKRIAETLPYYETSRAKGFTKGLETTGDSFNVKIDEIKKVAGSWEGSIEPSFSVKVSGALDDKLAYAVSHAQKANQDAVIVFTPGEGGGTKYTFDNVKNPDRALAKLHKSGVSGATIDGKSIKVYDIDNSLTNQLNDFTKQIGIKPTKQRGDVQLISKEDYGKYPVRSSVHAKVQPEEGYTAPKVTLNEAGTHAMIEKGGKTVFIENLKKGEDPLSKLTPEQAKEFGVQISTAKGREEAATKPVGEGETKPSALLERTLPEADSATYQVAKESEQILAARAFVEKYPERARAIAEGKELPPEGILKNRIVNELKAGIAKEGGDITDIATRQSLEATRHGQEIEALRGSGDPDSPEYHINEVLARKIESSIVYKKEGMKGVTRKIDEGVKKVTEKLNKSTVKIKEFDDIINSLIC